MRGIPNIRIKALGIDSTGIIGKNHPNKPVTKAMTNAISHKKPHNKRKSIGSSTLV